MWWLVFYPSAAVVAVYMWACARKRAYLDGVAAVQANSDEVSSMGTCVHSVCVMEEPWSTAEMARRFKATFLDHPRFARFKVWLRLGGWCAVWCAGVVNTHPHLVYGVW